MSKKVRLKDIVTALRAGQTPVSLGAKYLGEGIERTAYRLGKWAIKENPDDHENLRNRTESQRYGRKNGIPPVRTYYVPGWAVQPLLTPLQRGSSEWNRVADITGSWPGDIYSNNVGKDRNGTLRAFDW